MSYHKLNIHKNQVGSPYKIQEEFLEYIDAIATGNKVMAIQELRQEDKQKEMNDD